MRFTWTKIFFATVLIALTSCIGEKNPVVLEVGDQVPEFSVETSTGEVVTNRSLLGAVSCILFFLGMFYLLLNLTQAKQIS